MADTAERQERQGRRTTQAPAPRSGDLDELLALARDVFVGKAVAGACRTRIPAAVAEESLEEAAGFLAAARQRRLASEQRGE